MEGPREGAEQEKASRSQGQDLGQEAAEEARGGVCWEGHSREGNGTGEVVFSGGGPGKERHWWGGLLRRGPWGCSGSFYVCELSSSSSIAAKAISQKRGTEARERARGHPGRSPFAPCCSREG